MDQAEAATPTENPLFYRCEEAKDRLGQWQRLGMRLAEMGDSTEDRQEGDRHVYV